MTTITNLDAHRRQQRARDLAARLRVPATITARLQCMRRDLADFLAALERDLDAADEADLLEIIRQNDVLDRGDPGHDNPPAAA